MHRVIRRFSALWVRAQVSRHGHYSVERLAALDEYCRSVSPFRVAFVLIATPLPVLLLLCLTEMIPMRTPSDGWAANSVFWIKTGVAVIILCESMLRQAQHMIPDLPLSSRQRFVISVGTAIGYVVPLLWIASQWTFPIPFTLVVGAAPCSFVFLVLAALTVGLNAFSNVPLLREKCERIAAIGSLEMMLLILYPAYNAAFLSFGMRARAVFLLILPATKIAYKNALAHFSIYWPDLVPVTAVFSIELFNALYVASFMQNSGSPLVGALVLTIDTFHMILVLRGLFQRMRAANRIHKVIGQRKPNDSIAQPLNTLATVRALCCHPEQLDASVLRHIRLADNRPHTLRLSSEATEAIKQLRALDIYANDCRDSRLCTTRSSISQQLQGGPWIVPVVPSGRVAPRATVASLTPQLKTEFVRETLSMLFEYEYIVLAEYIECVVPFIYVVYMSWLHTLPNARFFPLHQHNTSASPGQFTHAMQTVAWYATLEIALFLVVHAVAHRRFSYPPLYQLAFTIESHLTVVLAQLMHGVLLVFQSALVHLGADFSFRFAWLHA